MGQEISNKAFGLLSTLGEAGMNALYPKDFQFYMIALELLTYDKKTIDYLSFPVTPESIQITEPQLTNIKKTAGGISSLNTQTFIPREINIKGTFGQKFRILFSKTSIDFTALKFSGTYNKYINDANSGDSKSIVFNPLVKNGYGVYKLLQSMCDKSTMVDDNNKPFKLYFYNPILGDHYVVKVLDLQTSMSRESNRLIYYNLRLKAISPLELDLGERTKILSMDLLQKTTNNVVSSLKKML